MKKAFLLISIFLPFITFAATDWSQPPVECVEEIVPKVPTEPCLDLTAVVDPSKDFPENFTEDLIAEWKRKRKVLTYCRFQEISRRESVKPGSQSADALKVVWMLQSAIETRDIKIAAVYKASRDYKIPFTILAGGLRQESLFATLGISPDGNNYSCSIGQFNILAWCNWISKQTPDLKKQLSWPQSLSCSELSAEIIKPFYDIAITKLGTTPVYKLNWEQFKDIQYSQVKKSLGTGTEQQLANRFQASQSFTKNCINPIYGIQAKANEIARVYQDHIPAGLKQSQLYKPGQKWSSQCREKGYEGAYPFHTGWLIAVGMYNAGPRILNTLSHYWGWNSASVTNPNTFINTTPKELVEGLYWGGKYNKKTDDVTFSTLAGGVNSASWFKMCVVQRHIARVVQHGTQSGIEPLVDTLEGANTCKQTSIDPVTGQIVTSAPEVRQNSSGVKN